ncbi:MAG TPA: NADH-quinone oxidoreductase subunit NuoF [Thermotogota bacterium]|nr:NADH-quinone oxidoreductase subunit NuoF [Thermotogota bacterium]HPJ88322.1 NADH-quinone oxidoreductase subunit NuoF [Thermotogota bacterium]HPR95330.1 NADH-quinone oxidoreductase subunit NuoF [Thermotogota bacterium]
METINKTDLGAVTSKYKETSEKFSRSVVVCAGTGCIANGSMDIYHKFLELSEANGYKINVALKKEEGGDALMKGTGCQGFCQMGPLVTIKPEGYFYTHVKAEDVEEIIEKTLKKGEVIERLLFEGPENEKIAIHDEVPFYSKQQRTTLKLCGEIDAEDIDEYISKRGYESAERAVLKMSETQICDEISKSGLRGRGGGGFPTGFKWSLAQKQVSDQKYIICNGDEGDPGAFMDRCLMEGNPHSVLEGMLIAGQAIGATEGYVYVRTEYPLAVKRLRYAVKKANEMGFLGENIFGSDKSFQIHVFEGAGAFVCGEETALISSIEGKRGMPMPKPPYPAQQGLFGKPTIINNVETLSTIPLILQMGAEEYSSIGTAKSSGTKTFALTGHVANTGLIEVPFGTTLRQIVSEIGGGVINNDGSNCGADFKAVQIGGPSGGCLTQEHMDMPLDYDNLQAVGAMVGSGGLVVMNKQTCMVKIARYFMQFTQNESCGKCVVCREGTKQMLNLLDDIIEGRATMETLDLIEELAETIKIGSLCGLGKTAPNPVLSTLQYFRDEYIEHIEKKHCRTGECKALRSYYIDDEKCKRCSLCMRKCPVGAISGSREEGYVIDHDKCIKCGACADACNFGAVKLG